jgi:hypothetical protein
MSEQISLFDLNTLPFEPYLHRHHVFLVFSSLENQKAAEILKRRFQKKKKYHNNPP